MNPPQVYPCSPSWTLLPPPSPYPPSGSAQCTRLFCPSWSPRVCSDSGPASRWCYPNISSSVTHFSHPQSIPGSGSFQWVGSLYHVTKVLELQLQHQSFQWIFRVDFLWGWLVWSPCSPRDSKSSPTSQFESINSSVLGLLYGPALISVHDYWKNHNFDYTDLCQQRDGYPFFFFFLND